MMFLRHTDTMLLGYGSTTFHDWINMVSMRPCRVRRRNMGTELAA